MNFLCRFVVCVFAANALLSGASIEGRVLDSRGQPVASVIVRLIPGGHVQPAKTDARGHYTFLVIQAGTYTVQTALTGAGEASFGPFVLAAKEKKTVDLKLAPAKPEFFDQPSFIVAGVADSTSHGGHGSDMILRSSDALAKATASLGNVDQGNPLVAVRKYQQQAEANPSEQNLFDWGAELLAHRAYEPAIEVFTRGHRRYPQSTRTILGLAAAHYAKGSYEQAAALFFEATDVNPSAAGPYLLLAKAQALADSDGYTERMARFAELHPDNPLASYFYAVSLWRHNHDATRVLELLAKALGLDPKLAAAHLQIGIVRASQNNFPQAITTYQKAIALDPNLEEAHFRLAQAYARTGEKDKAQQEFAEHDRLAKESAAVAERERREVQQFVIELRKPAQ